MAGLSNGQAPLKGLDDIDRSLRPLLSPKASIWLPGSDGYAQRISRWSPRKNPEFDVVIDVATEEDVGHAIRYANTNDRPFLALSGKHGDSNIWDQLENGVGINLRKLNSVKIAEGGKSANIGGGIMTKDLVDVLWEEGKMTTTGACECTGVVGPMLGGGHGWLQGQYGLMADNLISARLVLANGSAITVSETEHSDLFWALRGAGHNYGIVTSFDYKIYDRTKANEQWTMDMMIYTGDKLEEVFEEANRLLADPPVELAWFAMITSMPDIDPEKPVILFLLNYQGDSVPPKFSTAFKDLKPAMHKEVLTDLPGIAKVIGLDVDAPGCKHDKAHFAFPIGTKDNPIKGLRKMYDIQASLPEALKTTWTAIEGYSMKAVQEMKWDSTAFPDRESKLLISPFFMYTPSSDEEKNQKLDQQAWEFGNRMRDAVAEDAGVKGKASAYVNYGIGDESLEEMYGFESWRLEKLRRLKREYDPEGRFSWHKPIS